MAKKPKTVKTFLTGYLRRASLHWPARNEALTDARSARGWYKCAMCQEEYKRDQVDIDHIKPIVSLKDGFTTWDDYINALFCPKEGFQILCQNCHETKTMIEDTMRMQYKTTLKEYEEEENVDFRKNKKSKKNKVEIENE